MLKNFVRLKTVSRKYDMVPVDMTALGNTAVIFSQPSLISCYVIAAHQNFSFLQRFLLKLDAMGGKSSREGGEKAKKVTNP